MTSALPEDDAPDASTRVDQAKTNPNPPTEAASPASVGTSTLPPDLPAVAPYAEPAAVPDSPAVAADAAGETPVAALPTPAAAPETPTTDAIGKPLAVADAPEAEKTKKEKRQDKEAKVEEKAQGRIKEKAKAGAKEKLPPLTPIVDAACAHVERLLAEKLPSKMVFHDISHTKQVVRAARRLAQDQHLNGADTEALLLAAYFHDTGYTQKYLGHEAISAELAAEFLRAQNYPAGGIDQVQALIRATEYGTGSAGPLADTLVDADLSGMGREEFTAAGERLRLEWEMYLPDRTYSTPDWVQYQLDFLTEQNFRTAAARVRYGPGRLENIREQEKLIGKLRKKEKKKEKDSRDTLAQPKRGIETMFRNVYSTHTNLSSMADQKANMMIQLNTLLISALITYLAARSTTNGIAMLQNPIVAVPGALLLATGLGSVVTAILSAQPEITSFRLNSKVKPTANRRINLLFFGNFVKLPLEEFQEGMRDLMRQKDALYMNMTTDIYYLGDVLSKKYRLLKISYTIFMVGIILVVFSFVISILYKGHL